MNVSSLDVGHLMVPGPLNGGRATTLGRYELADSGYEFVFATPAQAPLLWESFLQGALRSYRRYGVERVLEYETVRTGRSTSMFIAIVDPCGQVSGGVRIQGPYRGAHEAHALVEWSGRPGTDELRREIAARIPAGIVEMKTGWVSTETADRHTLAWALARTPLHIMQVMDVRYSLCTVADHAVRRWRTAGAQLDDSIAAVAYPDERYRTVPVWWDSTTALSQIDRSHFEPLLQERQQLARWQSEHAEILTSAA